ncbi:MAG TPA: hypothetical protein VM261_04650 [Kofleriaceae bacterium]|nr:hypothetical protein [Kofleriaceae bacterium]
MKLSLVSSALLLAAACGGGTKAPTTVGNNSAAAASNGGLTVRSIDWLNRTYEGADMGNVTVENGVYEYAMDGDGNVVAADYQPTDPDEYVERGSYEISKPLFGDVTGDGAEEAVLVIYFNGGGTGRFTGIDVYGIRDGKETVIGSIPGGDRGDGGIDDVQLEGKVIVVARMMSLEGDGACCPSKLQHERWSWDGKSFVEDEAARSTSDFAN